jgi:hypothetical protein
MQLTDTWKIEENHFVPGEVEGSVKREKSLNVQMHKEHLRMNNNGENKPR